MHKLKPITSFKNPFDSDRLGVQEKSYFINDSTWPNQGADYDIQSYDFATTRAGATCNERKGKTMCLLSGPDTWWGEGAEKADACSCLAD